jgi:DNA-binding PadR family transcriptional regulator
MTQLYPKKETIALRTGLSERSIYNALGKLQAAGFIQKHEQSRKKGGSYGVAKVSLSRNACVLAGFLQAEKTSDQPIPDTAPTQPQATRYGSISIPAALTALISRHGLSPKQVVWLMSVAKQHGKTLESLLAAKSDYLTRFSGQTLLRLIKYLLRQDIDFIAVHRDQVKQEVAVKTISEDAAETTQLLNELSSVGLVHDQEQSYSVHQWGVEILTKIKDKVVSRAATAGASLLALLRRIKQLATEPSPSAKIACAIYERPVGTPSCFAEATSSRKPNLSAFLNSILQDQPSALPTSS